MRRGGWICGLSLMAFGVLASGRTHAALREAQSLYRFTQGEVRVPVSLPVGTVMATTRILPGERRCTGEGRVVLLRVAPMAATRLVMLATNVPGVGVRLTLPGGRTWADREEAPAGAGTVEGELVKTGPIGPGMVTAVTPTVYRQCVRRMGKRGGEVVWTERLQYRGALSVAVQGDAVVRRDIPLT